MNKKEMSEAIEEGMNAHTDWLSWQFLKAVFITIIVILIISLLFYFHNKLFPEENIPLAQYGYRNTCNYPELHCYIRDYSKQVGGDANCEVNVTDEKGNTVCVVSAVYNPIVAELIACGWTEANSGFENFMKNYENTSSKLKMECE